MTPAKTQQHSLARLSGHVLGDERVQTCRDYIEALEIEDLRLRATAVTESKAVALRSVRVVVILAALTFLFTLLDGHITGLGSYFRNGFLPPMPIVGEQVGREVP